MSRQKFRENIEAGVYILTKNRLRKRNFFRVKKRSESELRFRNFRNKANFALRIYTPD